MSFGAYLKQSRVLRELSLEEVATATRLPARVLAALESDDLGGLQDRAHAILVVRSYATAIGLDPEETALRLTEELQRLEPPAPERRSFFRRLWERRSRDPLVWMVLAATLAAIAALFFKQH